MKTKILLTILTLAIFASLAFAQADSCNLRIIDQWVYSDAIRAGYTASWSLEKSTDNYYMKCSDSIFVFSIDNSGSIDYEGSINCHQYDGPIKIIDTLLITNEYSVSEYQILAVYNLSNPMEPVAIDSFIVPPYEDYHVLDTLLFAWHYVEDQVDIYNISDPESIFFVIQLEDDNFQQYVDIFPTKNHVYYSGQVYVEIDWDTGYYYDGFVARTFEDEFSWGMWDSRPGHVWGDSVISYEAGPIFASDTLVFWGSGLDILTLSKTDTSSYIWSKNDTFTAEYEMYDFYFEGNYLYVCGYRSIVIIDASDPDSLEEVAYYYTDYDVHFDEIIVKDSLIIAYSVFAEYGRMALDADSLALTVFGFDSDFPDQCELDMPQKVIDFEIYPNPFNKKCEIKMPDINKCQKVDIYDINGKCIDNITCNSKNLTWEADNIPSGLYLFTLVYENHRISKKVIFLG